MDSTLEIQEYSQMDRVLKEERAHIVKMVKKIKTTGCIFFNSKKYIKRRNQ